MVSYECDNCKNTFSEELSECPHCSFPYFYQTTCIKCSFKSIKKYIICPKCRTILFGGRTMLGYSFTELITTIFCFLIIYLNWNKNIVPVWIFVIVWLSLTIVYCVYMLQCFFCNKKEEKKLSSIRLEWEKNIKNQNRY